jgi:AraC-like DNA-binding protein
MTPKRHPNPTTRLLVDSDGASGALLLSHGVHQRVSAPWATIINIGLDAPVEVESEFGVTRGRVVVVPAGLKRCSRSRGATVTIILDADVHRATYMEWCSRPPSTIDAPQVVAIAASLEGAPFAQAMALAGRVVPLGDVRIDDSRVRLMQSRWVESGASVSQVAAELGLSAGHLSELFCATVGTPFRTWAVWQRVRAALRSIAAHRGETNQVAQGVGFADQAHMIRSFSRLLDYTPGALRHASRLK